MLTSPRPQLIDTRRQIVVLGNVPATIMYTVPAGRTFTGHISFAGTTGQPSVNNVTLASLSSSNASPMPLTLLAGTVVRSEGTASTVLIGVES